MTVPILQIGKARLQPRVSASLQEALWAMLFPSFSTWGPVPSESSKGKAKDSKGGE